MRIVNKLETTTEFNSLIKFVDFYKFIDFLVNSSFHFTRLDKFEDKSEAISQRQLAAFFQHKVHFPPTRVRELKLDVRQKRYFASCWFSGDRESIGMWNIYSNPNSVAIKFGLNEFCELWRMENFKVSPGKQYIENMFIDKIHYKNYLSVDGVLNFKEESKIIGFQKDLSFSHEKEVRVLIKRKTKNNIILGKLSPDEIKFFKVTPKINILKNLTFEVIFHPQMQCWQKANIEKLVKAYRFKGIITRPSELAIFFEDIPNTKI